MGTTALLFMAAIIAPGASGLDTAAGDRPEPQLAAADDLFRAEVRPFLETYCVGCHGGDKPKGELNLGAFTSADVGGAETSRTGTWSWSSSKPSRCRRRRRRSSRRPRPAAR